MVPENYKALIKKLVEKTNADKATWNKTSGEDEYKLDLAKGAVTTDIYGAVGNKMIDFRIWNDQGDVIDYISLTRSDADYDIIEALHKAAKRNFFKVDQIVKSIFDELDGDDIIGNSEH